MERSRATAGNEAGREAEAANPNNDSAPQALRASACHPSAQVLRAAIDGPVRPECAPLLGAPRQLLPVPQKPAAASRAPQVRALAVTNSPPRAACHLRPEES